MRPAPCAPRDGLYLFFALACAITWLLAAPLALAWVRGQPPPAYAIPCAGLSAFGPLAAAVIVARQQRQLADVFRRWRAGLLPVALALVTPMAIHVAATALYVAIGGDPDRWLHPPVTAENVAALVVFPLGEELGWRGFAHPRAVARFGLVKGPLLLGAVWGVWHLAYSVTPASAGFDAFAFASGLVQLPLYSLVLAWLFEQAHRSLAVALAFHAGGHLDHIELAPRTDLRLHAMHLVVLVVCAALAARALRKRPATTRPLPVARDA